MALETTGFNISGAMPDLSQGYALGGLKPLSFAGGGQSPVAIAPLAGWKVESAHPEQVMQGLGAGLGAIAKGISAAYISKKAEDTRVKERGEDIALKKAEMANQQTIARMHAGTTEASQAETKRHNLSEETIRQQIADRGGNLGKTFTDLKLPPLGESKDSGYTPPTPDVAPIKGGVNFNSLPTDEQMNEMQGGAGENPPSDLNLDNNPLGNITAPVPIAAAPTPTGNQAVNALSGVDWSKLSANLGAGTGAGASPVTIPSNQPSWLRSPKAVMGSLSEIGGATDKTFPALEEGLAGMQQSLADTKAPTIPAYEKQINKNYKGIPDETAQAIYEYAKAKGYDVPVLTGVGQGMTEVKWPSPEQVEARKTREEAQKTREEAQGMRHDIQTQNTLNRESMMFQNHPAVKAFTSGNGMQQSLPRFIKDYDAIIKNPESAGISDVGLLDMFARAEGGGRVTEGQANLALGSMGLMDKAKQLGMKLEGGDRLSQNQRDQMLRVISEDHGVQVALANQAVNMTRNKLKAQGITDENSLPQPYIAAKTKWEALDDITSMKKNALAIHEQQKQAEDRGDKKTSDDLKRQLEDIGKSAVDLRKKIDSSKSAIINLDEIQNTPQGWGGSAAATLIQQP